MILHIFHGCWVWAETCFHKEFYHEPLSWPSILCRSGHNLEKKALTCRAVTGIHLVLMPWMSSLKVDLSSQQGRSSLRYVWPEVPVGTVVHASGAVRCLWFPSELSDRINRHHRGGGKGHMQGPVQGSAKFTLRNGSILLYSISEVISPLRSWSGSPWPNLTSMQLLSSSRLSHQEAVLMQLNWGCLITLL